MRAHKEKTDQTSIIFITLSVHSSRRVHRPHAEILRTPSLLLLSARVSKLYRRAHEQATSRTGTALNGCCAGCDRLKVLECVLQSSWLEGDRKRHKTGGHAEEALRNTAHTYCLSVSLSLCRPAQLATQLARKRAREALCSSSSGHGFVQYKSGATASGGITLSAPALLLP